MIQDSINIFSWIVLMKDSKILLLRKKNTWIRTIPFIKNKNGESITNQTLNNIESILHIKINPDSLVKSIIVNKTNEESEASIWCFSICIKRQWELKLSMQQENHSEFNWFEINKLNSLNITPDLVKILEAINSWKKYLEL